MAETKEMLVFAEKLREARIAAGYRSAAKFARAIGIESAAYRMYERGDFPPRVGTLLRICRQLNLTPNDLLWDLTRGER